MIELSILLLYSKMFLPFMMFVIYSVCLHLLCYKWLLSSEDQMPGILAAKFCKLIILGILSDIFQDLTRRRVSSCFKCVVNITRSIFQKLSYRKKKKKKKNPWQHRFITHRKSRGNANMFLKKKYPMKCLCI